MRPDIPSVRDRGAFTLRDYAFLADGERGALLDPTGNIAWLCAPAWDSPPVFASLLGGPDSYDAHPVGRAVWGGDYEPRSLIWRSRWVTDDDAVVVSRDALAFPGEPAATTGSELRKRRSVDSQWLTDRESTLLRGGAGIRGSASRRSR